MTEPAKPSIFQPINSPQTGGDQLGKPPKPPSPTQQKTSLEPPKQATNMLTSFTVPMNLSNPKADALKTEEPKKEQKQTGQFRTTEDKPKGFGGKPGKVGSGPSELRDRTGASDPADGAGRRQPQVIQQDLLSMNTLMQKLFCYDKIRNNQNVNEREIHSFVEIFGSLSSSREEKSAILSKLKTAEGRKQVIKLKYLNNQSDEKVLEQMHLDISVIIQRLFQKYSYLGIKTCLKLIQYCIDLNRPTYYQGKLQLKQPGTNFETSEALSSILKEIESIEVNIFQKCEQTLRLLLTKKRSLGSQRNHFLQALLKNQGQSKKLGENIWNSFKYVLIAEKVLQSKQSILRYSFQINVLLNCLNLCYSLTPAFFEAKIVIVEVLPFLRDAILFLERESFMVKSVDSLILNLALVHPFTIANIGVNPELKVMIMDGPIAESHPYLQLLLDNRIDIGSLEPLQSSEACIFLQAYISMNQEFNSYQPEKHGFIFSSICSIFKQAHTFQVLKNKKYPKIFKYIDYVIRSIFPDVLNSQDEAENQYQVQNTQQYPKYLGVCRLAKLISSLCLSSNSQSFNTSRFSDLIQGSNQIVSQLLRMSFELIREGGQQNNEANCELQLYKLNTEFVYEMLFRLFMFDPRYFQSKQVLIRQFFDSMEEFYLEVFTSHITKFVSIASYFHLNLYAFAALVSTPGYFNSCKDILGRLSALNEYTVELMDDQGTKFEKSELLYAVQQILSFKQQRVSTFSAVTHLMLSMIHFNPVFMHSQWMKTMTVELKKMLDSYHPSVVKRYAETLIEVLSFSGRNKTELREIQLNFDFRFINQFLSTVLAYQYCNETPKVFNKYMRGRKYEDVKLAVLLIKEMTNSYLKEKEEGGQLVPLEVRKLLELENKGGSFQLLFNRQATSYSVGLIIVLLSREFVLDQYLKKKQPYFKDWIFQTLTNLNTISSMLKHDISLKINHLYNRHAQIQINQGLRLKQSINQHIKWNPSFASMQFMMSWNEFRFDLKKELFNKIKSTEEASTVYDLQIKSHFIRTYWKQINSRQLKINVEEAWRYTDNFLWSLDLNPLQFQGEDRSQVVQEVLANVFGLSILIKKTCLQTYSKFLLRYYFFFFQFGFLGSFSQSYYEAIMYFLNIKSLVDNTYFEQFKKDNRIHKALYLFIIKILQQGIRAIKTEKRIDKNVVLELAMHGVGLLMDICDKSTELDGWLGDILEKVMKSGVGEGEVSTKYILLVIVLHARLGQNLQQCSLGYSNHHWLLLTNVLSCSQKLTELLLIDLPAIYNKHSVLFISVCHYFLNLVRSSAISQFESFRTLKLQMSTARFLETMLILLHKVIKEGRSYYAIWVTEILTEIIMNQDNSTADYRQVRKTILTSQVVHNQISVLLSKLAVVADFDTKQLQGCWKSNSKHEDGFSIADKLELMAYLRLLVLINYNPLHEEVVVKNSSPKECQEVSVLLQKQKQIFLSMVSLVPLLSRLMSSKGVALSAVTETDKILSQIELDRLFPQSLKQSFIQQKSKIQAHQVWQKGTSALDLLNEISSYELVSICTVWLTHIVNCDEGRYSINAWIPRRQSFDNILNNLVTLMDETTHRLELYCKLKDKLKDDIDKIFAQYYSSIYCSLSVCRQMHFTNTNTLNSHLSFRYRDITDTLGTTIVSLYRVLEAVFQEMKRGAIKSKASQNFKLKERNLRSLQSFLKNIDATLSIGDKSTNRFDSEYYSKNRTQTFF